MAYSLNKVKVLIVEDMQPMLSLTKSLLSIFGFKEIIGTTSAEEAFELYKKDQPDVVITDWLMEPMSGLDLIDKIRKEPGSPNPYVPIILMTGYSDRLRVERARDTGVTEFLVKPYTSRDLYARIVQIIEKPRQFVDAGTFFGPDRRRRKNYEYSGPMRRASDREEGAGQDPQSRKNAELLKKLREEARKV